MTINPSPFAGFFSARSDASAVKPPFSAVPLRIREDLCRLAGASTITEAVIADGGISASASFIVTFDTGLRLFVKGSHPGDQSHGAANLRGECMAYRAIDILGDIAPQFCGMVSLDAGDDNGWWLGAWQVVDVKHTIPYDASALFDIMHMVASHEVPPSRGLSVASAHPYLAQFIGDTYKWKRVTQDTARRTQFAHCFIDDLAAHDWLAAYGDKLCDLQNRAASHAWQLGLIHGDARCDNFIHAQAAGHTSPRWYLVDWANAADGALAFDRVMLAASLCAEGVLGGAAAYQRASDTVQAEDCALMTVMLAGYFADQMYRAPVSSMPRLRPLQRAMFWACAQMLSAAYGMTPPPALKVA